MASSRPYPSSVSLFPCKRWLLPSANEEKMRVGGLGPSILSVAILLFILASSTEASSLRDVLHINQPIDHYDPEPDGISDPYQHAQQPVEIYLAEKRAGSCPPWKPFQCPEGTCIPLKYLCDYNVDCVQSGYDENKKMCTAALRPTVESTEEFINHQLHVYGDDYFVKLLGSKAANHLVGLGGVSVVAVALTESPRLNDFASSVNLTPSETTHFRQVMKMISEGDRSGLAALDFKESEIESLQPVVEQLVDTGFLKTE